jgi:hypothetical protein
MKPVWTTASGEDIPVQEMTDKHLLNTISYLENFAERAKLNIINEGYHMLSVVNGEMAEDAIRSGIEDAESMSPQECLILNTPIYVLMIREAHKRGLIDNDKYEMVQAMAEDLHGDEESLLEEVKHV